SLRWRRLIRLKIAEQIAQFLWIQGLQQVLRHQRHGRLLNRLYPVAVDDGTLIPGVEQGKAARRLLRDQPGEQPAVARGNVVAQVFLAYDPAGIDEADQQKV